MSLAPDVPFVEWLRSVIPAGATVLDVGCGDCWYWPRVNAKFIGVDAWAKFEPDHLLDLEHDDLPTVPADVVLMADFLEHVSKERGLQLIAQAQQIAPLVLVLTPTVWSANEAPFHDSKGHYFQNPHVLHKSLYGAEDFAGFERVTDRCDGYYLGLWRR